MAGMLAWLGGGTPPQEPPDLLAESSEREQAGREASESAFPFRAFPWGRREEGS